jgi:hypothetical protein
VAVSPLGVLAGIVLVFLAPGYFLLQALFPGRRFFGPFHPVALLAMSIACSVAITILTGSVLGFLPGGTGDGRGWFQGAQTGAPIIELVLAGVSVILFGVAWARRAFPLLGRGREVEGYVERGEPEEVTRLRDLRLEEERLRKEARRVRKRAGQSRDVGVRGALAEAAKDLDMDRKALRAQARDIERGAGLRRYGRGERANAFSSRSRGKGRV